MMTYRSGRTIAAVAALSVFALFSAANAGDMTEDAIVKALTPQKPLMTRSLSSSKPAPSAAQREDEAFIDSLRGKSTRSLSASPERARLQTVAADKPAVDLTLEFDYNSASLRGNALRTAETLGKALTSPDLKGKVFVLAGHTDAKGNDQANQRLSERRADAVKQFLVERYGIAPDTLITVGFGKSQLKNASDPFSEENRRVQTVNAKPYESASK